MLGPHRYIVTRRLRNYAWPFLCGGLFFFTGCSGVSPDNSAFYSYVDAQGNVITVSRGTGGDSDRPQEQTAPTDVSNEASLENEMVHGLANQKAGLEASAFDDSVATPLYASTPDELWSMSDESYVTSDEFESEAERKDRARFVSYPDETGRLVTHPVDMVAAQEAAEEREARVSDLGEDALPEIGEVTRWSVINVDCCKSVLAGAQELSHGDATPVNIMSRPRESIFVESRRPAKAFLLDPSVKSIQLQSWNKKGYLYPQALFLDEHGVPLSRVVQIFTRKKAQTWASQAYLVGEIPIEPRAKWIVLFLDYAQIGPHGAVSMSKAQLKFDDMDVPLTLRAELVVRATSGLF